MKIRPEHPGDIGMIRTLTEAAFRNVRHSHQTEAAIVDALRAAGAMTLSLVAAEDSAMVGHVAFSPVGIDGAGSGWYGLGPVSVRPDRQRNGIGQALIREGLARLGRLHARGCVVLGDPRYYARFGFRVAAGLCLANAPPEYFQVLAFSEAVPVGKVAYHPAFDIA